MAQHLVIEAHVVDVLGDEIVGLDHHQGLEVFVGAQRETRLVDDHRRPGDCGHHLAGMHPEAIDETANDFGHRDDILNRVVLKSPFGHGCHPGPDDLGTSRRAANPEKLHRARANVECDETP